MIYRLVLACCLLPASTALSAQAARVPAPPPSPQARCLLRVLTAEGYRVQASGGDTTARLLLRTLTGVDKYSGRPDPADSYTELVRVRLDEQRGGVVVESASIMRPTPTGAASGTPEETARLDGAVRALLRDAAPLCAREAAGTGRAA